MESQKNVHRDIPDWLYPSGRNPRTQQSRPDGIVVLPMQGRNSTCSPLHMNPRDRDIHLMELEFCSDTKPEEILAVAQDQHKHTIQSLRTRPLRGAHRNNRVSLHTLLIGVAGTIYNTYTIKPLTHLGLNKEKAQTLAKSLQCHAVEALTKSKAPKMPSNSAIQTMGV